MKPLLLTLALTACAHDLRAMACMEACRRDAEDHGTVMAAARVYGEDECACTWADGTVDVTERRPRPWRE